MKLSRVFLVTASLIFLLVSCREGAQFNGPVGNYLHIAIELPETEDGESLSRVIHPDSEVISINLTYSSGDSYGGTGDLDDNDHIVDQLPTGQEVLVEVILGIEDLPLCSASVEMDINPGANSVDLVLDYNSYTVQGNLINDVSQPVANQVLEIDGTNVTTDASGNFSFVVTTENWDGYTKFYMVDQYSDKLEFARNKRTLIENRSSFQLVARPEFFVDMTILSDSFPLKGATVKAFNGETWDFTDNPADENGRVLYGPIEWTHMAEPLTVEVEYKGVFVEHQIQTRGAPGAVIGEVVLDPYVIFFSEKMNFYTFYLFAMDFDSVNTTPEREMEVRGILNSSVDLGTSMTFSSGSSHGGRMYCDYQNGYIYLFCRFGGDLSSGVYIVKLDGFSTTVVDSVDVDGVFSNYDYTYTIQQMYPIEGGNKILATTSNGAFTFSTATMDIVDKWISPDLPASITILNGGYEASDGSLYVMGEDFDYNGSPVNNVQRILRLNSDGTMTTVSGLPSPYNDFSNSDYYDGSTFASLIGLYPWGENVLSVKTQDAYTGTGGEIINMSNWSLSGASVDNSYDYLVPVGILPDNRFYVVNETTSTTKPKKILRLENASDSSPDVKEFMSDASGGNQSMFYYFDASGLSNPMY